MKKTIFLIAAILVFAATYAHAEERCANCMMKVFDDSPYRVTATHEDGSIEHLCSLFCGSIVREGAAPEKVGLTVVDYNTGEAIRAEDAVWVEGGDIRAMMSDKPRVAFRDKASAGAFVREHGGEVTDFDTVYAHSVDEWRR